MKLIQVPVVIVPFNICRDSKIRCTLQDLRNQDTNWATFWFDLARFDDLTQIHEFVRLSSGLATWHPLLCPQAWGKGFYVFFYGSDFRALEALAHCHWDANELSDESDEGFVMSLNSAWTLPSPFLKRLRRHRENSCWRYPKTSNVRYHIFKYIQWIKWIKKQPRWIIASLNDNHIVTSFT